jgi:hypothetical protein
MELCSWKWEMPKPWGSQNRIIMHEEFIKLVRERFPPSGTTRASQKGTTTRATLEHGHWICRHDIALQSIKPAKRQARAKFKDDEGNMDVIRACKWSVLGAMSE